MIIATALIDADGIAVDEVPDGRGRIVTGATAAVLAAGVGFVVDALGAEVDGAAEVVDAGCVCEVDRACVTPENGGSIAGCVDDLPQSAGSPYVQLNWLVEFSLTMATSTIHCTTCEQAVELFVTVWVTVFPVAWL